MTASTAAQRELAERRRAQAAAGKDSKGRERNSPDQMVHGEERIHDENTDRQADDISAVERENEITEWRRHSDLDAPPARPGYVNRWIRTMLGPDRDLARLRKAIREGWTPVKASAFKDSSLPTIHLNQFGDVIGVEGMVLCELSERLHEQRKAHYAAELARQSQASESDLRNVSRSNAPGFGPIQQTRQSQISARVPGKPIRPATDDD